MENQEFLTSAVMMLLKTLGPPLLLYFANLVRQANTRAKKEHWYALVAEFAHTAVVAAEQLSLSNQLEGLATSKFAYALGHVETMLLANGVKLDVDIPLSYLKALIEAEVGRLPMTPLAVYPTEVLHSE